MQPRYVVYRDLRQRGFIVKLDQGDFNFRVYPRGASPHNSQAKNWVLAISEMDIFNIAALLVNAGHPPMQLLVEQEDLEHYFLRLVGAEGANTHE